MREVKCVNFESSQTTLNPRMIFKLKTRSLILTLQLSYDKESERERWSESEKPERTGKLLPVIPKL